MSQASDPGPFPERVSAFPSSGNGPGSDAPATGRPRCLTRGAELETGAADLECSVTGTGSSARNASAADLCRASLGRVAGGCAPGAQGVSRDRGPAQHEAGAAHRRDHPQPPRCAERHGVNRTREQRDADQEQDRGAPEPWGRGSYARDHADQHQAQRVQLLVRDAGDVTGELLRRQQRLQTVGAESAQDHRGQHQGRAAGDAAACQPVAGHSLGSGATNSAGLALPPPNRNFSISSARNLRALGSMVERRYSLMSIVWWPTHARHASAEMLSKMRLPSSPG